jgi:hypothetical protein
VSDLWKRARGWRAPPGGGRSGLSVLPGRRGARSAG